MKNKIIKLLCLILVIGLGITGYFIYDYKTNYVTVYVASHNIQQRTKLSLEDIKPISILKSTISEDYYLDSVDIINKYVKLSYSIPLGSFIYKEALETNIKDLANSLLKEKEVNYDLFVSDIKLNTAHLNTNMYLDLYLTIDKGDKVISDLLLSNCRIIGFYDSYGKQIRDYDLDSRVYIVSLAINKEHVNILNKSLVLGTISSIVNKNTYEDLGTSILNEESKIMDYLA